LIGALARDKNKNPGKKLLAVSQCPQIICTRLDAHLPYFAQSTPFVLTQKVLLAKLRSLASFIKMVLCLIARAVFSILIFYSKIKT
jgi:hypothetical protein